jgi:hypothetical protein
MVTGRRSRRGQSALGCLVVLLLVAVAALFGWEFGESYYRNYALEDAMKQSVRFAARYDDARIKLSLRAKADSLGITLPPKVLIVRRTQRPRRFIRISAVYVDTVRSPLLRRVVTFRPRAEGPF